MIPAHIRARQAHRRRQQLRYARLKALAAAERAQIARQFDREQARFDAIVATIPTFIPVEQLLAYRRQVAVAVANLGARKLASVIWPWRDHEQARTPRGRLANPTALR